jgi:hypothetical protein
MRLLLALLFCTTICSARSIDRLAQAIAKAEGFYSPGATLPKRCGNPGDLKALRSQRYPGQVGICKGGHVRFRTQDDGWAALNHQLEMIVNGESKRYTINMSLQEIGRGYAGSWRIWSRNVAHNLGTTPDTYLFEVLDIPPILEIK